MGQETETEAKTKTETKQETFAVVTKDCMIRRHINYSYTSFTSPQQQQK